MAAFFRGLLLFFFGAIVGAGGILFFTPSFHVVVSRGAGVVKPVEVAIVQAPAILQAIPAASKVAVSVAIPAPIATVAPASPPPSAPSAAEPSIDFKAISEHFILWPTSVTVKTATTVPVMDAGKKVQDLALAVGTTLQVSKVLADGSLEVRAKGAKFEIKSAFTDFSVELGKLVSELVAKGAKIDSPFATGPVAMTPTAPAAASLAPAAPAAPVVVVVPKGPLTLAQRVDVLFGNKPEAIVEVAPTPAADKKPIEKPIEKPVEKTVEKGKDLDRKMNQLFK